MFLFAILLIIFLAGGSYLKWFPLRGLISTDFQDLSFFGKILDYFWHLALPIVAMTIGGFATLTMLTKNSFLDEINKQYVMAARAKGLTEKRILRGHVFRNAMLLVISGFPAAFIGMFFTGSLLIEVIFSLEGLGLLGFEATMQRDYPVMFGTLYMFTLLGLVLGLVSDLTYTLVDPRIDFAREGPVRRHASEPAEPGALAPVQGQPAGLLLPVDLPGPVRHQPVFRAAGQRQAAAHPL